MRAPHLATHTAAPPTPHPPPPAQVLDQLGFSALEAFPVYADRMPNQLLAYLRLARLQDPALFAKVRRARLLACLLACLRVQRRARALCGCGGWSAAAAAAMPSCQVPERQLAAPHPPLTRPSTLAGVL